jgi:hypothetical protein
MNTVVLKNQTPQGDALEAIFLPEKGMNMVSFKRGSVEVIDQSTLALFEERYAGLGALIGPHFHHRNPAILPVIKDESLFPHIAKVKAKGILEPFSHGIARYAPWKASSTQNKVSARLTGKDQWMGILIAELEGQNFTMNFNAELLPDGLHLDLSVVSEADSVVGIHYYYHLPKNRGTIFSQIQNEYRNQEGIKPVPSTWKVDAQHFLTYDLNEEIDCTFYPFPDPLTGTIVLDAIDYRLTTTYRSPSQENSWQLYHPKGASFVCIEPLSSQDPRHPNLTVSNLHITLQIEI